MSIHFEDLEGDGRMVLIYLLGKWVDDCVQWQALEMAVFGLRVFLLESQLEGYVFYPLLLPLNVWEDMGICCYFYTGNIFYSINVNFVNKYRNYNYQEIFLKTLCDCDIHGRRSCHEVPYVYEIKMFIAAFCYGTII